jgi:hypothetical protein
VSHNPRACGRRGGARTIRETKRENGALPDGIVTCPASGADDACGICGFWRCRCKG